MSTVNQFKNVLGLYPRGWRVPLVYRRDNQRTEVLVRLMGVQPGILDDRPAAPPPPRGGPRPPPVPAGPPSPAAKFFKEKEGFANYYYNEIAQKRVLDAFVKNGDFSKLTGDWTMNLGGKLQAGGANDVSGKVLIQEKGAADGKSPRVLLDVAELIFPLEPLNPSEKAESFKDPPGSGGLVLAFYLYRQLLVYGAKGFTARVLPRRSRAVLPAHGVGQARLCQDPRHGRGASRQVRRRRDTLVLRPRGRRGKPLEEGRADRLRDHAR